MEDAAVIERVADLVEYARARDSVPFPMWYRGQTWAGWTLTPKLWRPPHNVVGGLESSVVESFRTMARARHRNCPATDDLGGWLSLIQHYGAPTRLLDWSMSPLVAAYFAVCDVEAPERDGAVFTLAPRGLNREDFGEDGVFSLGRPPRFILQCFGGPSGFSHVKSVKYRVAALLGDEVDLRQISQASAFTVHAANWANLLIHPAVEKVVARLKISAAAKPLLRAELAALGVTKVRLFPDLQTLGDDLLRMKEQGEFR